MTDIKRIFNIAESLAKLNGWKVERIDINKYSMLNGKIEGFCGYLTTEWNGTFRIRDDGTFELVEHSIPAR